MEKLPETGQEGEVSMEEIVIGHQAPDFRLSAAGGAIQLSDYLGKTVILYFYPRDNTPG
jgi:peroxiredoxin Q/BCP